MVPGASVGPFVVVRPLGRGGTSTVYAVRHRSLGTEHALKVLHVPALDARLRDEGGLHRRIESPYVVPVLATLDLGDETALLMPQIRGCSLKELLEIHALEVEEARALFVGIVDGVAAAHAARVVHRDLKPANVLLDPQSGRIVPRVTDFGIAQTEDSDATATGAFLGTRAYAAPEQQRDASTVDARADLWSLGVLFHEMLTGRRPGPGGALDDAVPLHLRAVLGQLLEPDPERRCPTTAALREQLGEPPLESLGLDTPIAKAVRRRFSVTADPTDALPTFDDRGPAPPPAECDRFVGRRRDLERLAEALDAGPAVTLTGFGGMGKTRLLVHFVRQEAGPPRVHWCDLTEARDEEGALVAVAKGVGVSPGPRLDVPRIGFALGERGPCIVALDNAEGVVDPLRSMIEAWTAAAPAARFVITSRVPLGLPSERRVSLDPLDPDDATALFVERARAADARFDPTTVDPGALRALVLALDGVPLAIELAAARVRLLGVERMLERLSDRFRLLATTEARPQRQATLRATLDWSWSLLDAPDRRALAQLSVFEGGFSLEALEAVVDGPEWALDVLERLVGHSLVQVGPSGRFHLLLTVQAYAAEALDALGGREEAEARHGAHFAWVGAQAAGAHQRPEVVELVSREVENLVAACERATDRGAADVAAATLQAAWLALQRQGSASRAATLSSRVLATLPTSSDQRTAVLRTRAAALRDLGRMEDAREALELAVAQARTELAEAAALVDLGAVRFELGQLERTDEAFLAARSAIGGRTEHGLVGRLDLGHGRLAYRRGAWDDAEEHLRAALARTTTDPLTRAEVRTALGALLATRGAFDDARRELLASLRLFGAYGAWHQVPATLRQLAHVDLHQGRLDDAERHLTEALERTSALGLPALQALLLVSQGVLYDEQGSSDAACRALEDALRLHRLLGNRLYEGIALANLARMHAKLARYPEALATFDEALEALQAAGDPTSEAQCRLQLAELLVGLDRPDEARGHLERAIPALRESGNAMFAAIATARLGDVAAGADERATAHAHWRSAVEELEALGATAEQAKVLAKQAWQEASWDVEAATATLAAAEALTASLDPNGPLLQVLGMARDAVGAASTGAQPGESDLP